MSDNEDQIARRFFGKANAEAEAEYEADHLSNMLETIAANLETSRLDILKWYAGYQNRTALKDDDL